MDLTDQIGNALKALDESPESTRQEHIRSLLTTAFYLSNQFHKTEQFIKSNQRKHYEN